MPTPKTSGNRNITITGLHLGAQVQFTSLVTLFEDTWTPQWRPEFVYGRMDPISFYGGTDRKLSLGFKVISEDVSEAYTNMKAVQKLIRMQYPTYEARANLSTIKAPPYFKIAFYNVTNAGSKSVTGYFNGPITINPGFGDKTKTQYFSEQFSKMLFSDIEIRLQMTVLHSSRVGYYNNSFPMGGKYYPYNLGGSGQTTTPATPPDPTKTPAPEAPTVPAPKRQTASPVSVKRDQQPEVKSQARLQQVTMPYSSGAAGLQGSEYIHHMLQQYKGDVEAQEKFWSHLHSARQEKYLEDYPPPPFGL